jgi:protein transport protein SEC20
MFDDHTSAVDTARRRLQDIRDFQLPRLRQCDSSLAQQQQLSAELHEDMDNMTQVLAELAVAIEDQQGQKARLELEKTVNEMRDSLSQWVLLLASRSRSHEVTSTG